MQKFHSSDEHLSIGPFEESKEIITDISKNYRIIAATSRGESRKNFTYLWLSEHFPRKFSKVYFTKHPYYKKENPITKRGVCELEQATFFIDDSAEHIIECSPYIERAFLMDCPWNRDGFIFSDNVKRISSLREIIDCV